MKLLVVRDQHEFASHLCRLLELRQEDLTAVPVAWEAIGETVSLQKLLEQQQPDYLICAVRLPQDAGKNIFRQFQRLVEQLERSSRKHGLPLVFLSSAAVFDGLRRPVAEDEPCNYISEYGRFYAALEERVRQKLRKHIILRTTWWFSAGGENFLGEVIDHASTNALISLNSAAKGCPTCEQDIARVVIAILLQMDVGAENWGTYHYASADTALGFQFMESIVAQASQFDSNINPKNLFFEHNDNPAAEFYFEPVVLLCQRLLDAFGIHQRSWRSYLSPMVRAHFESMRPVEERVDE